MPIEGFNLENKLEKPQDPGISKDFFAFQFEFAKELYNKAKEKSPQITLFEIIKNIAPELRAQIFNYDNDKKEFAEEVKEGITEENLVDKAYESYLYNERKDREVGTDSLGYGHNQKFGPIYYLTHEDEHSANKERENNISVHFSNDYDMNPRELLNVEERKKDIANLLKDIKNNYPDTKTISTASWLLDALPLSVAGKLFPQSFIESMRVKEAKVGWSLGTMIWGQFLDAKGGLKTHLAEELIKNIKNMKEGQYLIDLLQPPLHKPKSAVANIEDFYRMYNI